MRLCGLSSGFESPPRCAKTLQAMNNRWFAGVLFSGISESARMLSLILGIFNVSVAGIVPAVGCLGGIPVLVFAYGKIYSSPLSSIPATVIMYPSSGSKRIT